MNTFLVCEKLLLPTNIVRFILYLRKVSHSEGFPHFSPFHKIPCEISNAMRSLSRQMPPIFELAHLNFESSHKMNNHYSK